MDGWMDLQFCSALPTRTVHQLQIASPASPSRAPSQLSDSADPSVRPSVIGRPPQCSSLAAPRPGLLLPPPFLLGLSFLRDLLPSIRVAVGGIQLRTAIPVRRTLAASSAASGRPPSKHASNRDPTAGAKAAARSPGNGGTAAGRPVPAGVPVVVSTRRPRAGLNFFPCTGSRGKIAGRPLTETSAGKPRSARPG
jgi:hypothetical protein